MVLLIWYNQICRPTWNPQSQLHLWSSWELYPQNNDRVLANIFSIIDKCYLHFLEWTVKLLSEREGSKQAAISQLGLVGHLQNPNSCSRRIPIKRRLNILASKWIAPAWSQMQDTRRHPSPSSTTSFDSSAPNSSSLQNLPIHSWSVCWMNEAALWHSLDGNK